MQDNSLADDGSGSWGPAPNLTKPTASWRGAWETISPTASDEPLGPPIDPCALLTSEEVQAVLGEPIQDVRRFCA